MRKILQSTLALLMSVGGCTTVTNKYAAHYRPSSDISQETVRYTGEYTLCFRAGDSKTWQPVDEAKERSTVVLLAGDEVGFRRTEEGFAVALLPYGERRLLKNLPPGPLELTFRTEVREKTALTRSAEPMIERVAKAGIEAGLFVTDALTRTTIASVSDIGDARDAQEHGFGTDVEAYRRWKNERQLQGKATR